MIHISTLLGLGLLFVQTIFSQGIGINTTSPDRMLDVEDGSGNPQIRITYTSGTVYAEMTTNALGDLGIIATNDRVGIGTNSPQNNLHVCSKSLGTSGDAIIKISSNIDNDNINDIPYLMFAKDANANAAVIGMEGNPSAHIGGSLTNSMILGTLGALPAHIATSGTTRLTIATTGEIGIGTNAPVYLLDVAGTVGIDDYIYHNGDANTYIQLRVDRVTLKAGNKNMVDCVEGATDELVLNQQAQDIDLRVESLIDVNAFYVDGAVGTVGIGTNTPNSKLDIGAGAVTLKEMVAPASPPVDQAVFYVEDDGSGKTRLMIKFNTGAAQQIAIQP